MRHFIFIEHLQYHFLNILVKNNNNNHYIIFLTIEMVETIYFLFDKTLFLGKKP